MAGTIIFSHDQLHLLTVLERIGGSLSLFSVTFIFLSYAYLRRVRTAPNTFIILASIAEAGAAVGHIIGMQQGGWSPLCVARGLLLEM